MQQIQQATEVFKSGGVVIFPTDTAYGIGCRMDNVDSVHKVYELRNRPKEKAVLVLVSDIEMAQKYVEISERVSEQLIKKYWPGGVTIILPCKTKTVSSIVRAEGSTLAVRMPDHTVLRKIIQDVGVPIIAPSANFSGDTTPFRLEDVNSELLSNVDFVLEGECTTPGQSTIIDCSTSDWKIVRQGVVEVGYRV